jgi:hypothetical protein
MAKKRKPRTFDEATAFFVARDRARRLIRRVARTVRGK